MDENTREKTIIVDVNERTKIFPVIIAHTKMFYAFRRLRRDVEHSRVCDGALARDQNLRGLAHRLAKLNLQDHRQIVRLGAALRRKYSDRYKA